MNQPLPVIYCKSCYYTQDYRGQTECIHCGKHLSNWSVASQLQAQKPPAQEPRTLSR